MIKKYFLLYKLFFIMLINMFIMKFCVIEANQDLGLQVNGTNLGPKIIIDCIENKNFEILKIDKPNIEKDINNHIKNLNGVNTFNKKLYDKVLDIKNSQKIPITIGGDHSIAIATALASLKAEKKLGIIWIDAHTDYNTFDTTITGNIHGLPLAALNNLCPKLTEFYDGDYYKFTNTVIVGARDIDDWELPNLKKHNITIFTTKDIQNLGVEEVMKRAFKLATYQTSGVHISYDIDVIDPKVAPGVSVPVPDGISIKETYQIVDELVKRKEIIKSMDLVEYNPLKDINEETKNIAVNIVKKVISTL